MARVVFSRGGVGWLSRVLFVFLCFLWFEFFFYV